MLLHIIDNIGNSMNRHMQQIDHQTGGSRRAFCGLCCSQSAKTVSERMDGNGSQEAMMLAQSNLTGNDMKVMWAMLARLDYENLIQVNQAEVSEQVGMNRHNVNRSIKKLIELGVI